MLLIFVIIHFVYIKIWIFESYKKQWSDSFCDVVNE